MENVQLTIADLASLKTLLEAAANRGAFKAAEMSTVGSVYDKLAKFIDVSTTQLAQQQAEQPADQQQAQGDENA